MHLEIENAYLCELVWSSMAKSNDARLQFILDKLKLKYSFFENKEKFVRASLTKFFFPRYQRYWQKTGSKREVFERLYASFLQEKLIVEIPEEVSNQVADQVHKAVKRGRPRLPYEEGSPLTKMRRARELNAKHSPHELYLALQATGINVDIPEFERQAVLEPEFDNGPKMETPEEALAMYMDCDLSKNKYNKLRKHTARMKGHKVYPSYYEVYKAKLACYPEVMEITYSGAKVDFISLLDHTVRRILSTLKDEDLERLGDKELVLLGKWGMDGASGQQTTRQKCESNKDFSDQSVFMVTFVPIELRAGDVILWKNEKTSSVFYCRPIAFEFLKETPLVTKKYYNWITKILEKVQLYQMTYKNQSFDIKFDIRCTMLDGKACNVLCAQKSSNCCNICGVGPKFINVLSHIQTLSPKTQYYKFCMPILHSWIRSMEYILHISYNMDFKKSCARGSDKEVKKVKKKEVQKSLKNGLSLSVDVVKQGAGTSNTGNVARDFFNKPAEVSALTGIDEELIVRLHTILQVLSCGQKINADKFGEYALETAKKFFEKYGWYKMPPSLHKLLMHGADIIRELDLPPGWFSEEPQESDNKEFRKARAHNSRMCDRTASNEDILHHLLILSDPVISSLRICNDNERKELTAAAQELLESK